MWFDASIIKTPETHPGHPTVGRFFKSWPGRFFCTAYDPRIGFWMENVANPLDRRNISERAVGRTYHEIYSFDMEYQEVKALWAKHHVKGQCSHHLGNPSMNAIIALSIASAALAGTRSSQTTTLSPDGLNRSGSTVLRV